MNLIFSQLLAILRKNLRLLLRSKSSSVAILLGPLLVILIVGAVFTSSGTNQATIGVYSEDFANVELYQESLTQEFSVVSFDNETACVDAVRKARTSGCVAFKQGREAIVYVDPTKRSLVYSIIDRVTGQLDAQSGELRAGIAERLLSTVSSTESALAQDQEVLSDALSSLEEQEVVLQTLENSFSSLRVDTSLTDSTQVRIAVSDTQTARDEYQRLAQEILSDYESLARDYDDNASVQEALAYQDVLDAVESEDADEIFDELIRSIEQANQEISSSQQQSDSLQEQVSDLSSRLTSVREDIASVLATTQQSAGDLGSLDISDQDITSPITTRISPVNQQADALGSIFPAFLALLIMFTTMLLASQLVINERSSRAYFRNFTTPTPDWVFVLATYVTTLIVVLIQLVLLFLLVGFIGNISVLSNFFVNLIILFSIVTFFSFLGMLLGYAFKTQEGVMLSSITISSLFLLLSELVLPVDTLPGLVRFFVQANPFVLSSSLLSGTLVFGLSLGDIFAYFSALVLYSLMLFASIMILQRIARIQYFESSKTANRISTFLGESEIPPGKELHIGDEVIDSKESLLRVLISLSDEEYEEYADHQKNLFAQWVSDVYKDERLARLLRNTSRQGAITVLKNELQ